MSKHAPLSPSAAHRWMHCIGSTIWDSKEDTSSPQADRGTRLHDVAAKALEDGASYDHLDADDFEIVDAYVKYVNNLEFELGPKSKVLIEQRVHWNDLVHGTADVIILSPYRIDIIDLKTGNRRVPAHNNEQLMVYLIAALSEFNVLPSKIHYPTPPLEAHLHIVQPTIGSFDTWKIDLGKTNLLNDMEDKLVASCNKYTAGLIEFVPSESACRYCKGASECKARSDYNIQLAVNDFELADPKKLSNEDIARILPQVDQIADWVAKVQAHAANVLSNGEKIDGYKLVAYYGNRKWKDEEKVVESLKQMGFVEEMLMKKSVLGIGAIEKLIGKKHEFFQIHCERPEPRPIMAATSDPREEWGANKLDGFDKQ